MKAKRDMRSHTHRITHGAGHIENGGSAQVNVHSLIRVKWSNPKEHNIQISLLMSYKHTIHSHCNYMNTHTQSQYTPHKQLLLEWSLGATR